MDFNLSNDLKELKKTVEKFIRNKVDPRSLEIEENDEIPNDILKQSGELGLFGLSIPEKYGGLGLNMVDKCAIYEELGKTSNGYTTVLGSHNAIGTVGIVELGSEKQKEEFLPKMATGEWIGSFALSEPSAGSHASNLKTTAERKGDKFILNGSKHYITNGEIANVFTVMAVTEPKLKSKGITSFIVEKDTPGLIIGKPEKKMGLHGARSVELFFDNCEISSDNVLGEEHKGYVNALKILANGRTGLAARNLGSCIKLLEYSLDYSMNRYQFNKPIFEQQIIQHYLAEMATEIETLKSFVYRVAWLTDEKNKNISKEASMAKLYGSEVYNRIADLAVQIHGGVGYISEYPIERYYRDARITRIYEGTSEIQKNIIASELKKEYYSK